MFSVKNQVMRHTFDMGHLSDGYIFEKGNLKYYNHGELYNNKLLIDNDTLYFNADGNAVKNTWIQYYNSATKEYSWYYFNSNFTAEKDWMPYNSNWYHFDEYGKMLEEKWIEYNGKWYYLKKDGTMAKNEKIDGYYVNKNGEWIK